MLWFLGFPSSSVLFPPPVFLHQPGFSPPHLSCICLMSPALLPEFSPPVCSPTTPALHRPHYLPFLPLGVPPAEQLLPCLQSFLASLHQRLIPSIIWFVFKSGLLSSHLLSFCALAVENHESVGRLVCFSDVSWYLPVPCFCLWPRFKLDPLHVPAAWWIWVHRHSASPWHQQEWND